MSETPWRRVAKRLIADIEVAKNAVIDVEQGDDPARIKFIKLAFARVTLENSFAFAGRALKRERAKKRGEG